MSPVFISPKVGGGGEVHRSSEGGFSTFDKIVAKICNVVDGFCHMMLQYMMQIIKQLCKYFTIFFLHKVITYRNSCS